MKKKLLIYIFSLVQVVAMAQGDDGWNHRVVPLYDKDEEVARVTLTFTPGFETTDHPYFLGYIDPDLPTNWGSPVTDGEFNLNYIRRFEPIRNNHTSTIPVHNEIDYDTDWKEDITYFDGLGREIQQTMVKASAYYSDVVIPVVYDDYGRKQKVYLPYAIAQDGANGPGGYRSSPETEITSYYTNYFNEDDGTYPYSEKKYDDSPLNRVLEQSNPGNDWSINETHTIINEYGTNISDSEVYRFNVSENNQLIKLGCYNAQTLSKFTYSDENNNITIEYKDLLDKVVTKVVKTGSEDLITQYVYDDFGLLRYVLPPESYSYIPSGTTPQTFDLTTEWIKQLCYYYQYDNKKRMAVKKLPGVDDVYMVYNNRDQLILSQDGVLRQTNDWLFTKYDIINRQIISGKYHHSTSMSQSAMQTEVNSSSSTLYETYVDGTGYSNSAYPVLTSSDEILTVTYYDNYQALELYQPNNYSFNAADLPFYFLENGTFSSSTKGMPTITEIKVLLHDGLQVSDDNLVTLTYYDKFDHPIQTITDNHTGGQTTVSSQYNFTGEVEETKETIDVGWETNVIHQKFAYDHVGRITETHHKINNQNWIVLSRQKYNETGHLSHKYLHGTEDAFLQHIKYKYNIRGWLTDINDIANPGDNLFAMKLDYNKLQTGAQYNGNIARMTWQSGYFSGLKQYDMNYDGANRITSCTFADANKFSTQYSYDKNGNIETLLRMGELGGTGTYDYIDNLDYSYNGNQLKYVNDATGNNYQENGFSDNGSFLTTNEYFYDQNGNLTKDLNKQISNINYNILNLPRKIDIVSDAFNTINYIYTATGEKLQKSTSINAGSGTNTNYLGNIVYVDNASDYMLTSEGRAKSNGNVGFNYEYFLKDHLGNTRVTFDMNGDVLQDNSYYPFGMDMGESLTYISNNSNENKYKYNGKEMQDDFELGWYDYGWRMYDAAIGRWHVQDPLSESYENLSPYNYVANNPIIFIDPDGRSTEAITTKYVDPSGKEIIDTDDGSNDVFVVPWSEVASFTANADAAKKTGHSDSKGWNNYWRGQFTMAISEDILNQLNSESSKQAYIDYYFSGGYSDWMRFLMCEVGGQWTNPDLVIQGLSMGVNGLYFVNSLKNVAKTSTQPIKSVGAAARGFSKVKIPKGFKQTRQFGYQHGQKVYMYKGKYYSRDIDGHNGGVWKVFEESGGRLKRIGTADEDLNIFKN